MGQSPDRNRSVIGCHAAKIGAGKQHGARAQVGSTESGEYTCRSSTNNNDVYHLWLPDDKRELFPFSGRDPMSQGIEGL